VGQALGLREALSLADSPGRRPEKPPQATGPPNAEAQKHRPFRRLWSNKRSRTNRLLGVRNLGLALPLLVV
jgi:hypothetical protein